MVRTGFTSNETTPAASGATVVTDDHEAAVRRGGERRSPETATDPAETSARAEDDRATARPVEPEHADGDPRRAEPERRSDERRRDLLRAGRASRTTSDRKRPDGVAAPLASTTRASTTELRLHRPRAEEHRAPAVVRRCLVPRIRPRHEVRDAEAEHVLLRSPSFLRRSRSSTSSRPSRRRGRPHRRWR